MIDSSIMMGAGSSIGGRTRNGKFSSDFGCTQPVPLKMAVALDRILTLLDRLKRARGTGAQ